MNTEPTPEEVKLNEETVKLLRLFEANCLPDDPSDLGGYTLIDEVVAVLREYRGWSDEKIRGALAGSL